MAVAISSHQTRANPNSVSRRSRCVLIRYSATAPINRQTPRGAGVRRKISKEKSELRSARRWSAASIARKTASLRP